MASVANREAGEKQPVFRAGGQHAGDGVEHAGARRRAAARSHNATAGVHPGQRARNVLYGKNRGEDEERRREVEACLLEPSEWP